MHYTPTHTHRCTIADGHGCKKLIVTLYNHVVNDKNRESVIPGEWQTCVDHLRITCTSKFFIETAGERVFFANGVERINPWTPETRRSDLLLRYATGV